MGASTGTEEYFIGIMAGKFLASTGVTIPTAIDNTQFHDYRLDITPGGGCDFYVDGSFVSSINPNTVSNTPAYFIGDGTTTANAYGEIISYVFTQADPDFTDIAASANVDDAGSGHGLAWGDFDGDGDQDLYATNRPGPNRLYRNDGGGFTDIAANPATAVDNGDQGTSVSWVDYDNDGDLDLYLARSYSKSNIYH